MKRRLNYLFRRRLAVMPLPFTPQEEWPSKMIFQWQHMPVGYHWF